MAKYELKYDKNLKIRSGGLREWKNNEDFNRTESTPYRALDTLFRYYDLSPDAKMVDYGCGKGRVTFYVNEKFDIPVTGVEANDDTFDELVINHQAYSYGHPDQVNPVMFEYGYAQNYNILEEDNVFYFFNPFSIKIFKKVMKKIKKSYKKHPRQIDVILYYPVPAYVRFMKHTKFKLIHNIDVPDKEDRLDMFRIYRLGGKEI